MLKHLADYYTLELAATVKAQFPKNCGMVELYWARRLNGGTEVKQGACEIDKGGSAAGYYVVVGTRNPSVVGHI
ncbi:MAG: hypothetical protein HY053_01620, partial [Proteobacteria bacterium]|nr:hypothetical protein [Pseudomonadota bacterium]